MQKIGSLYLYFFIVILALIAVFAVFNVYSQFQENKSAESWEKTFGRIEDLPNQYPYRNDNEAAEQLKVLAVRLGIDFNVYGEGRRFTPLATDASRLENSYRDYFRSRSRKAQAVRIDDSVDPPLASLAKYLFDYRTKLEDVRDFILTGPPILWRQNLNVTGFYPSTALPNVYAISTLQRILSARVLQLAADRNYEEAEEYLEAQWKLNESLRSRSDLASQQQALDNDIALISLMRKLPLAENWIPKIVEHNYEKAYIKGFKLEAWSYWKQRDEHKMAKNSVLNKILDPYRRWGFSSVLEEERQQLERLQATNPCDLGHKEYRETNVTYPDRIPWSFEFVNMNVSYAEIAELKLTRELTTKVIKVKHGYFPKDGREPSEACKDGSWEYWRSAGGSTNINYKGKIDLPRFRTTNFPSPFTVNAHAPRY